MTPGNGSEPTPLTVGRRKIQVQLAGPSLIVTDRQGQRLDPQAAEVLIALGGAAPDWLPLVESLGAVAAAFPDDLAAVTTAAQAIGRAANARAELARTSTDRAVLIGLAAFGQYQVGGNPACDATLWDLVRYHPDEGVQQKALRHNEVLPPALGSHHDTETRRRVAANPACPPDVLAELAKHEPPVRTAVAGNPGCPPRVLVRLARDSDNLWVRIGVASNRSCPKAAYKMLRRDRYANVRNAFLLNPSVPVRVAARQIFADPTPSVHAALASRVDLGPRSLIWLERYSRRDPANQYNLVRARLMHHPACPSPLKARLELIDKRLAGMGDRERKRYAAALDPESIRFGRYAVVSFLTLVTLASLGGLIVGLDSPNGPQLWSGLLSALAWCGVIFTEGLTLAVISKIRGPFLTWRPPRWRPLGRYRLNVPLAAVYVLIYTMLLAGTADRTAVLAVGLPLLAVLIARAWLARRRSRSGS